MAELGSDPRRERLVELLVEIVELVVSDRPENVGAPRRYASARENPLGSARAFLDAGRRGDFATFKRGREVVARWEDVERWIESRRHRRRPCSELDDAALLEAAGVRLRRSGARS